MRHKASPGSWSVLSKACQTLVLERNHLLVDRRVVLVYTTFDPRGPLSLGMPSA